MHEEIIKALRQRRALIRARWEALLRIEKVTTPLANPDTLVFALDQSLDEIFADMGQPLPNKSAVGPARSEGPDPWRAYFRAGEQALLESLVLLQAEMKTLDPATRDTSFGKLKQVIKTLTEREFAAWDALRLQTTRARRARRPKIRPRSPTHHGGIGSASG